MCVWYCDNFVVIIFKKNIGLEKVFLVTVFKKYVSKNTCLVKIYIRWIFTCEVNEKQVSINEK
jgi:hypothetical protein